MPGLKNLLSLLWSGHWSGAKGVLGDQGGFVNLGTSGVNDENIDEQSALAVATYFQCIRNIGEDCAKLPFRLIKNDGRNRIQLEDPLVDILASAPNPHMTAFTFRSTMIHWAAGWGNGFAEKIRAGRVLKQLNPIHPSRVVMQKYKGGGYYYKVYNDNGTWVPIEADKMFHLYGMSGDGLNGYSVVKLMNNSLGLASTVQRYAKNFYQNSARPAGILQTPQTLKKEHRDSLAEAWKSMYSGPTNAGKTAVLDGGVEYKGMSIPMKDMEFIELRRFQKEEIAGWFRMPLYKLQDIGRAQGWSTLDAQETDYVNSCLMPWLCRFEQEVKRQLMADYPANIHPHLEVKGLLRGDVKTRTEYIRMRVTNGMMTPNEGRMYEDENPSNDPAADKLYIQGAMVPLDKAGTQNAPTPGVQMPEKDKPDDSQEKEEKPNG